MLVSGRLSLREDREPQIICDSVRPIADLENDGKPLAFDRKTLYIKLEKEDGHPYKKVKPMLAMFPGKMRVVLYHAQSGKREASFVADDKRLIDRLSELLGEKNVVIKLN